MRHSSCALAVLVLVSACAATPRPAAPTPPVDLVAQVALAHRGRGAIAEAARLVDDAIAAAAPADLPRLRALRAVLAADLVFVDPRLADRERAVAEAALAAVRTSGDRAALGTALDARGFLEYGVALWGHRRFADARPFLTEALAVREAIGDGGRIAETLFHLGLSYEQEENLAEARPRYERALALATAAGDDEITAYALRHLAGFLEAAGDRDGALDYHRRCLALRIKLGHTRFVAFTLLAIGDGELAAGREALAVPSYQQAFAIATAQGDRMAILWTRVALAGVDERAGRRADAAAHLRGSLTIAEELGLARVAAMLRGRIAALTGSLGIPSDPVVDRTVPAKTPVPSSPRRDRPGSPVLS
jgi:tetratricopeptide (TPR) repeat protein